MVSPAGFFQEVVREIKKVSWPTTEQTRNMTILVISISVLVGVYLGLLDFIFRTALEALI